MPHWPLYVLALELACSRGVSHGQLYSLKLSVLHTIMFSIIIQHCTCTKTLELACSRGVSHGQLYSFKLSVLHVCHNYTTLYMYKNSNTSRIAAHSKSCFSQKKCLQNQLLKPWKNVTSFVLYQLLLVQHWYICSCKVSNSSADSSQDVLASLTESLLETLLLLLLVVDLMLPLNDTEWWQCHCHLKVKNSNPCCS